MAESANTLSGGVQPRSLRPAASARAGGGSEAAPPAARARGRAQNRVLNGLAIVAAIYWARDVLVPIVLAGLLSFLLTPTVGRLERLGSRRAWSVGLAISLSFLVTSAVGWVVFDQISRLAVELPSYRENIRVKIEALHGPIGATLTRLTEALDGIKHELPWLEPAAAPAGTGAAAAGEHPIAVEVQERRGALEMLRLLLGSIIGPLATAALVLLLSVFMLASREDIRNRILRLAGLLQLSRTTLAIDDATSRVGRYLRMQVLINACFGSAVAIGLSLIGLPNALLWGALSFTLRFVPYLGPWISALLPLVISFAIFPGWGQAACVAGMFVLLELVCNNLVEPWLYGASTGLSRLAVVSAAVFWAWIWGPVGLLISTPLTVCLVVAGKHVPSLEFLHVLLGDEPVLDPAERLYQRLLAGDDTEAMQIVESFLEEGSIERLCEEVLIPALCTGAREMSHATIDAQAAKSVRESIAEIVEGLEERGGERPSQASTQTIQCIPARDEDDRIAGLIIQHAFARSGIDLRIGSPESLASETLDEISSDRARGALVVAVSRASAEHARYILKRLRKRFPNLKSMLFTCAEPLRARGGRIEERSAEYPITSSIADAAERFRG